MIQTDTVTPFTEYITNVPGEQIPEQRPVVEVAVVILTKMASRIGQADTFALGWVYFFPHK